MNPNAAIDKTVIVNAFHLNDIHRPDDVRALPGGKGCNVARGLKTLGDSPVVSGWVGGYAGQFIETGLHREGIETAFVHTDFESRTCLSILDPGAGTVTEIYERGDPVPADRIDALREKVRAEITNYRALTLSGSLPTGVPADFYCDLITIARDAGIPAILDSSGDALRHGVEARPALVKPNEKEFADLVGRPLDSVGDYADAAAEFAQRTGITVVVTLGPDGAIAANGSHVLHVRPPQVTIQSAVGSGDCMLAGLTYGLTHDFAFEDSLITGVAAGTANVLRVGAGIFTRDDYEQMRADVSVELYA